MFPVRKVTAEHVSPLREEETRGFFFLRLVCTTCMFLILVGSPGNLGRCGESQAVTRDLVIFQLFCYYIEKSVHLPGVFCF